MFGRYSYWLRDIRLWSFLGLVILIVIAVLGVKILNHGMIWVGILAVFSFVIWMILCLWKRAQHQKFSGRLSVLLKQQSEHDMDSTLVEKQEDIQILRDRMQEAIKQIKTSKLGDTSGNASLYELPWYMIIGNPAAGKSTAIVNSGLNFPFSNKSENIIQGIGGTRNCDWFFTTEGILLDTAGRYSIYEEDRREWLGFLKLLKKARSRAPINGILIAVSIAELIQNKPEYAIDLAKKFRQRIQELTDNLEIFAPVYILFTKVDLISGFADFFGDDEVQESDRVWGSTFEYRPLDSIDIANEFEARFQELYLGLRESSVVRMSLNRGKAMSPGLMTFPYEFALIKPALKTFITTVFEDNPFQFKPVFRGFYFTSAVQEETSQNSLASEKIAEKFTIDYQFNLGETNLSESRGFFLKNLFAKVIFADRFLVRQHISQRKHQIRLASFFASIFCLSIFLGMWTWSYLNNQRLLTNIQQDLQKITKLQDGKTDLASRLESLEILQDRLEQLKKLNEETPFNLGLGLYQGEHLSSKLRLEYFNGINDVLLKPVSSNLEEFLIDVNMHRNALIKKNQDKAAEGNDNSKNNDAVLTANNLPLINEYKALEPSSIDDAYNALKTYIMLSNHEHLDAGHLNDQITRFWRIWIENNRGAMSHEKAIRSAEHVLNYFLAQIGSSDFPLIENNLTLIDQTRATLSTVVNGVPARERVYAEIKLRASTRFAPLTVARIVGNENKDLIAGSAAVSGAFTKEAWDGYVQDAIKDAANKELQSTDWVLKSTIKDDLTLEGSPEQIQKLLTDMYKTEYIREWKVFTQNIAVLEFANFDQAVSGMNRLGDPEISPIYKLMNELYRQTSWDNPSVLNAGMKNVGQGLGQWFKNLFSSNALVRVNLDISNDKNSAQIPVGAIGKEFITVAQLMVSRGDANDTNILNGYLKLLSKLRSKFNELKNSGDIGPGAKVILQKTLDGSGSELAEALRYVDEQMLIGASDSAKVVLRPMLVRPLIQAFSVLIKPTEHELNKVWSSQVYEPFHTGLGNKYPFSIDSRIEASPQEISQYFGSDGLIAKFANEQLGALVIRRGDIITSRSWADLGINLEPVFISRFSTYTRSLNGVNGQQTASAELQTLFQLMPIPMPGISEYTLELDGQILRYRNGTQQWINFVWPNITDHPGAKLSATTNDGKVVEILNIMGHYGLEKLISSATKEKKENGEYSMSWSADNVVVRCNFRIISSPQVQGGKTSPEQSFRGLNMPEKIAGE